MEMARSSSFRALALAGRAASFGIPVGALERQPDMERFQPDSSQLNGMPLIGHC
jgi:hypothetical protein